MAGSSCIFAPTESQQSLARLHRHLLPPPPLGRQSNAISVRFKSPHNLLTQSTHNAHQLAIRFALVCLLLPEGGCHGNAMLRVPHFLRELLLAKRERKGKKDQGVKTQTWRLRTLKQLPLREPGAESAQLRETVRRGL